MFVNALICLFCALENNTNFQAKIYHTNTVYDDILCLASERQMKQFSPLMFELCKPICCMNSLSIMNIILSFLLNLFYADQTLD